jgi:hypothetical protein
VAAIYPKRLDFSSLTRMVMSFVMMPHRAKLDAEYWRGIWISTITLGWLSSVKTDPLTIRLPYEQQPWQLRLIGDLKTKFGQRCHITGDVHSSMTSFPSQFGRFQVHPDQLKVHGSAYKRVLTSYLGWHPEDVDIETSRRYPKKLNLEKNTIFLPYDFRSPDFILKQVLSAVSWSGFSLESFEVRVHPARKQEPEHLRLLELIQTAESTVLDRPKNTLNSESVLVITVGVSTTLLEALEAGYQAIGVYENPDIEVYSTEIWSELSVKWITSHVAFYEFLGPPGAFITYP